MVVSNLKKKEFVRDASFNIYMFNIIVQYTLQNEVFQIKSCIWNICV